MFHQAVLHYAVVCKYAQRLLFQKFVDLFQRIIDGEAANGKKRHTKHNFLCHKVWAILLNNHNLKG
jgi:hypothetical protein